MATRKCGKVIVKCSLVPAPHMPHGEQYKCVLSVGGQKRGVEYVGISRTLTRSIDSPAAFSDAASAALSFALSEGKIDENELDYTDSGYHLQRPKARR